MNLPNALTLSRLVLTAIFVLILSLPLPADIIYPTALLIFVVAGITDWLDGYLARKMNLITDFGKLMDPLADKILTAAAFIFLIPAGVIAAWAVIIIISREFLVTGLRLIAVAKGHVLPAERLGKYKTISQMASIIYLLLLLSLSALPVMAEDAAFQGVWALIGQVIVGIAVVLTAWSGVSYVVRNRALLADA